MSVSGFEDAYKYATKIIVAKNPDVEIKVPTIPGMAFMKLISWDDAGSSRPKDAQDMYFFLLNYKHTHVIDRIFIENQELLVSEGLDDEMASIRLLGQDMAKICNTDTRAKIIQILRNETSEDSDFRLTVDIMNHRYDFEDVLIRLQKLRHGFEEVLK
ncbi:MAG: hypothetical protein MI802_20125 [Desulfobacterales bacterium]|nr:hypothetical protein [Desulfobacterales bacterium]